MKAEFKPRIDLVNRTPLQEVIPLRTPFIINIDPSDTCNFKCKFCPTGDRPLMMQTPGRNFGPMSMDLFKKIIDDCQGFEQKIKVIRLYKDGEPLMNRHFPEMVKYAKDSGVCDRIDTTTNASLLTPEKSLQIIKGGLTRINISIEGINKAQYLKFSDFKIDFEKLVENVRFFYEHREQCEMIVKINGDAIEERDKDTFLEIFGDIADGVYIEHIMSCWPNFDLHDVVANDEFGIYGQQIKEVEACPYVFYSFSLNSDGTASSCFLDWKRELILGDAKTESVPEIWNGQKFNNLRRMMLEGKRKNHPFCKDCGQMTHGMPDNIDPYRTELLARIPK